MSPQYDVSPEKRKIVEENVKRRLALRNELLMKKSDPFRHASGEGGTVFDPALQRYQAMRVSCYEYFKPNAKNARYGLFFTVIPIVAFSYLLKTSRDNLEKKYRSGEVAYKDRPFKFA